MITTSMIHSAAPRLSLLCSYTFWRHLWPVIDFTASCSKFAIWLANLLLLIRVQTTLSASTCHATCHVLREKVFWRRYCGKKRVDSGLVFILSNNDIRDQSGQNFLRTHAAAHHKHSKMDSVKLMMQGAYCCRLCLPHLCYLSLQLHRRHLVPCVHFRRSKSPPVSQRCGHSVCGLRKKKTVLSMNEK